MIIVIELGKKKSCTTKKLLEPGSKMLPLTKVLFVFILMQKTSTAIENGKS